MLVVSMDKQKSIHEPNASLLGAQDAIQDAERLQELLWRNRQQAEQEVQLRVPFTVILKAIDQLEANWQRILASRQSAILDGRLFEAEKRQFELGLRTSTDVLQAQTTFANSQSAEILALAEYQIALVDLSYATGTLLGAAKVRWEPIVPQSNIKSLSK